MRTTFGGNVLTQSARSMCVRYYPIQRRRAFSVLINRIQQSNHPGQHYLRRNVRQPHGNRI